ncbi:hypothetical protein VTH82DRAFT_7883 [Thermothelomyces myriococcoides]
MVIFEHPRPGPPHSITSSRLRSWITAPAKPSIERYPPCFNSDDEFETVYGSSYGIGSPLCFEKRPILAAGPPRSSAGGEVKKPTSQLALSLARYAKRAAVGPMIDTAGEWEDVSDYADSETEADSDSDGDYLPPSQRVFLEMQTPDTCPVDSENERACSQQQKKKNQQPAIIRTATHSVAGFLATIINKVTAAGRSQSKHDKGREGTAIKDESETPDSNSVSMTDIDILPFPHERSRPIAMPPRPPPPEEKGKIKWPIPEAWINERLQTARVTPLFLPFSSSSSSSFAPSPAFPSYSHRLWRRRRATAVMAMAEGELQNLDWNRDRNWACCMCSSANSRYEFLCWCCGAHSRGDCCDDAVEVM